MLEETLKWRSTFKPEEIRWVSVSKVKSFGESLPRTYSVDLRLLLSSRMMFQVKVRLEKFTKLDSMTEVEEQFL